MFIWNAEKRRYERPNGDVVTNAELRSWVDDFAAALVVLFMGRARAVVDALANISIDEQAFRDAFSVWNDQTRADIRGGHLAACALAFGGFNVITTNEFTTGEQAADFHASFWDNFVGAIVTGAIPFDGNFVARSGMYGAAVFSTFQNATRAREKAAGMTEERRRLGASDHCPTCLEQAAIGWVAIGSLRAIGDSECRSRCRCYFQFR